MELKTQIQQRLQIFADADLRTVSMELLNTLGYRSEKALEIGHAPEDFLAQFDSRDRKLRQDKALFSQWKTIEFLFQITDDEVRDAGMQSSLGFDSGYDPRNYQSYLFFALDLKQGQYTRTQLSDITREINLLFTMPAMLLIRHGGTLTLSVIDRRPGKRDESRDVLEKVKLIKDIRFEDTHRAHIEILYDLSLPALIAKHACTNFLELHKAWRTTLDSDALNKRFYRELADWYFWVLDHVQFPDDVEKDVATRNATNVIRLLTRLIFCWFLKEKGLLPPELFNKKKLQGVLKSMADDESTFYRAILQNLFFATLNQKMNTGGEVNRKFTADAGFKANKNEYGVKNLYRYQNLFAVPEAEAISLFEDIPFLNGGLFDCLDKEDEAGKVQYVDGFTRNPRKQPSFPNFLFFSDYQTIDLSTVLGDKKKKREKVRGLINLLDSYKFTITENTPIEEEIALDPELLGKVFENLLASYNPETGTTARKQTGSFYTPREIVNYMVDESLIAYLEGRLKSRIPRLADMEELQSLLREVFAYTEKTHPFNEEEVDALIAAIDECKILDPACGSGAFPMGILHKLVFILRKIDPHNTRWKQKQMDKLDSISMREELERAFRDNDDDYGRKLYLIENCIYGVDIQPIAIQISKLRFFISLICDQRTNRNKARNCGVRPLPNLETKFVAANTLMSIERGKGQLPLTGQRLRTLEEELAAIRHRHFAAQRRRDKLALQKKDAELRKQIAAILADGGMSGEASHQLAAWNPYDQNTHADFFDPEWMFGVGAGFDVTIGNPPYVRADASPQHLALRKQILASKQYETLWEKWDLFVAFIEKAYKLLATNGVSSLIVSDAYCHSKYAQKSQNWFLANSRILRLDFFSKIKIFDAGVHNVTYFFQNANGATNKPERRVHDPEFGAVKLLPTDEQQKLTYRAFFPDDAEDISFSVATIPLAKICYISVGMVTNANEKICQGTFKLKDLLSPGKDNIHPKPFVEGKDVDAYLPASHKWIEWGTKRAPAWFRRQTFPELYEQAEKLLLVKVGAIRAAYDSQCLYTNEGIYVAIPWHSLGGVRNRSIRRNARYADDRPQTNMESRENLEKISSRFFTKFLLGLMNSKVCRKFMNSNRRSNVQLYPDDWKKLPIPEVPKEKQAPIVKIVNKILDVKRANPSADISDLERQVDEMVTKLYGLAQGE